ncbi:SH3 domain-containing protein [Palleronia aestuarii]|uniref:SH3 domain-containing protein n=1 Tax=Palleronia aestuarii TaxID=568105 RepID=A0A2W7NQR7_9RHOB|nr:SH3 domain-containing protein [Palleronia aestuarii]PZX13652.1 SH3 domain-containing protein [Palleronia aestuarii]
MLYLTRAVAAAAIAGWALIGLPALAQDDVRRVDVRFAPGTSGASYSDTIVGYDSIEYFLTADAGQRMRIDLSTSNLSNYFNIWPPGDDAALFTGASSGDHFDGSLPRTGEYRVQVFLMRNAARRAETADFTIDIAITGETASAARPTQEPDFADGLAGGPDWYVVEGVQAGDRLNIRTGPSTEYAITGQADNGARLRNLGCQGGVQARWCRIETSDGSIRGWVSARFIAEGAPPDAVQSPPPPSQPAEDVPGLVRRTTGEFEVGFASGCMLLFNPAGDLITAGSTCSPSQSIRAADAVAAFRREQGLHAPPADTR